MNHEDNILVLGGTGMVGSAITRRLKADEYKNVFTPTRNELDLMNQDDILNYIKSNNIEYVFMAAAKVGGINANIKDPAGFGYLNGMINLNVVNACHDAKIKKMLFLGSSCVYPRDCEQPMKEEYIMTGKCEPTNEMYAISKIYGIKLCEAYYKQYGDVFISCQPCNIYGLNDHFNENSHVVSSLIEKFHNAKVNKEPSVFIWGSGIARREFMYVDDCAEACVYLMNHYIGNKSINVGSGEDISISDLAKLIGEIIQYNGEILFDKSKPDGMPQKLLDVTEINSIGWKSKTDLRTGIINTYKWYLGSK